MTKRFPTRRLFEATREISFSAMFREKLRNMTERERQIRFRNVGDPARSARFLSTYEHGTESPYVFYGVASFEKLFRQMSDALSDGRNWLVGSNLTLGDINLMPFVARLEYLNILDIFIADRQRVQTWWQQSKELTGYQKAIPNMLTEEDTSEMRASGTQIRDSIRTHRATHLTQYKEAAHSA